MGFIFVLLIAGFVIFMWTKNSKANQAQWQQAAEQLNLAYYAGGLGSMGTISGSLYGHRVTISTFSKSSGNNSQTYTKYNIEYFERIRVDMKMTNQGALQRLGKVFGMQDIEVGSPGFDDRVLLKGSDPAAIRRFLTPGIRDSIKLMMITYSDVTITNEHVCVNKQGRDTDSAIIVSTAKRLLKFCDEMNAHSKKTKVRKNEAVLDKHPSAEPTLEVPKPPEIPVVEPDFDQFPPAHPIVPEPPAIPADKEPKAAVGGGGDPAPEEPVSVIAATASEPEETGDDSIPVDLKEVAKELFGGNTGGSLAANKLFDAKFKGRAVAGSGVVKRVGKFNYDPVFTNMKGVKVRLAICEMAGAYSRIKVNAEVVYPPEDYDTLQNMVGSTLPISGKLIDQDPMMNQLYVAKG